MIGAGIFTTSGLLMTDLQSPLLMMGLWLLGGLIALCGALSYGELGAAMPRAGGEYLFLSRLYHPSIGFLSGWVSFFVGFSAPIAASAIGFSDYLGRAFPGLLQPGILPPSIEALVIKKGISLLVILGFTLIHIRGIVFGSRVQNLLTILKVLLMTAIIGIGFAWGRGGFSHLSAGHYTSGGSPDLKTMGLSLMWIMFAYSGWNAAAYIGSEIKEARRNLPRSLLIGTGMVIILYLLLNLFYLYAIPPGQWTREISVAGRAVGISLGPALGGVISLMVALALFSSLSAFIILGPRVYYAMARNGHFFRFAGQIHPRFQVPVKSIILQGLIAGTMVLLGTFDQVLTYMGFSLTIFPLLSVAGVFRLRRLGQSVHKARGYPLVQVFFILMGSGILILAFIQRPVESGIALATVAAGIPFFWMFARNRREE